MTMDMTPSQAALLVEILHDDLKELRMEIAHTEHAEFKERLRKRLRVLEDITESLERMTEPMATAA